MRRSARPVWAVEKTLGKAFTPEVMDAWAIAYIVLPTTMIDAAWPASLKARGVSPSRSLP